MTAKKYRVRLTKRQRKKLKKLSHSGVISARKLNRAQVLLLSDEGRPTGRKTDQQIAEILEISKATVVRLRRQFVQEGFEASLNEKARSGRPDQLSGLDKVAVTALACTKPPVGYANWSLRLLADKLVELELVDTISHTSVKDVLKKNKLKPHLKRQWCLGKLTTLFLWRMEQILTLYELPYDPKRPLICVDERPCQLIGDVLVPIPMEPGKAKRESYQYKRNGVCTVFMAFEPLTGWRYVQVRKQRTKVDYAHFMQDVADRFAQADLIKVVQDNLNTHNAGSFYQAFTPEHAFGLAQRFEMVYTPTKASWLNMVEIELSILSKQCLDRRIADIDTLEREVLAWVEQRNQQRATVNWQFTKEAARDKFKKFYPTTHN
jgi:transposase